MIIPDVDTYGYFLMLFQAIGLIVMITGNDGLGWIMMLAPIPIMIIWVFLLYIDRRNK